MKKRILVVDDQAGIRLLLSDLLTSEGYQVSTASTGKEALEIIQLYFFSLIIMDYRLPIFTGVEVVRKLEKDNIKIPTILISGLEESIREEVEKNLIVKAVILKPFDVQEMIKRVKLLTG